MKVDLGGLPDTGQFTVTLRDAATQESSGPANGSCIAVRQNGGHMYVREVVLSYRRRRGSRCPETLQPVSTPHRAAIIANELLNREPVEVFGILCLSTRQDLIAYHEVSRGSLDTTVVHPRDVFKAAILANSAGIVLVHNHPSGDPAPSADDLAITQRLKGAADLLGIELLDHVIVGHDGRYTSIRELGKL